jgi:hypothetical protein
VAKYDVDRFIHVSSYNANKNSPSGYFATKVCLVIRLREPIADYCRDGVRKWHAISTQRQLSSDQLLCSDSKTDFFTGLPV